MSSLLRLMLVLSWVGAVALPAAHAQRVSDVKNTKHNLSAGATHGGTKASTQTEICVFCHTPHGANTSAGAPLWNRRIGGAEANSATNYSATYTAYTSESLDARSVQSGWSGQPLGSSKLCLSCHDGTIALGNVVNAPGSGLGTQASGATSGGGFGRNADGSAGLSTTTMPVGGGLTSGYTRNLGQDLSNDHPISVTYDMTLTVQDGELRRPDTMHKVNSTHPLVGVRGAGQGSGIPNLLAAPAGGGTRPVLPLETTTGTAGGVGQVQCTTCHDPHIKGSATDLTAEGNIKFLRRNRFQLNSGPTDAWNDANDIMCLACHRKGHDGTGPNAFSWAYSAHANPAVAGQAYTAAATTQREFPAGIQVWKVACLNCHDTHTVAGAKKLTRGGTSGAIKLEDTCYQCHGTTTILQDAPAGLPTPGFIASVPNVQTDFGALYAMPIASEAGHAPGGHPTLGTTVTATCAPAGGVGDGLPKCGADGVESPAQLAIRHAECTDCHNPHRVVRLHRFDGKVEGTPAAGTFTAGINSAQTDKEGTHYHVNAAGFTHNNVASGVLRGSWGVEPEYASANFNVSIPPTSYTVRRGDPGSSSLTGAEVAAGTDTKTYVTREYQICLKCHSSYAYGNSPPTVGPSINLSPGVTNFPQYTDQAREFHSPAAHATESSSDTCPSAGCIELGDEAGAVGYDRHNHRSWHPVMRPTGRTPVLRDASAGAWRTPWSNAVGTQTMYCSDCHGSNVAATTSVIPTSTNPSSGAGNPWGPHGSSNRFLLKGTWNNETGYSGRSDATWSVNALCQKCHEPRDLTSGFSNTDFSNLHNVHQDKIQRLECTWCHVAVPHGWKNKALLVNLNDVGPEAGETGSKEVRMAAFGDYYTKAPYYLEAKLKVKAFARSGNWTLASCGSANKIGNMISPTNRTLTDGDNQNADGYTWMTDAPSACVGGGP